MLPVKHVRTRIAAGSIKLVMEAIPGVLTTCTDVELVQDVFPFFFLSQQPALQFFHVWDTASPELLMEEIRG